jgi:hypothetical protein
MPAKANPAAQSAFLKTSLEPRIREAAGRFYLWTRHILCGGCIQAFYGA